MSDDGGYAAVATEDGRVLCLNRSGSVLWECEFPHTYDVRISGDGNYTCILGGPGRTLYYLDDTGKFLWNRTMPSKGVLFYDLSSGGENIIIRTTGAVLCYDQSGERMWHHNTQYRQAEVNSLSSPLMSLSKDGSYFIVADKNSLRIMDDRGLETGRLECDDRIRGTGISADGSLVAAITDNELYLAKNPNKCVKFYGNNSYGTGQLEKILDACNSGLSNFMDTEDGPLEGYGISYKGYIILLWDEEMETDDAVMDEIYSVIDEAGKREGIDDIPAGFLLFSAIKGD